MADDLKPVVVRRNLLLNGTNCCARRTVEGWLLKGTVIGVLKDQRPMLAHYEIYLRRKLVKADIVKGETMGVCLLPEPANDSSSCQRLWV
jgi:hypothetical protein